MSRILTSTDRLVLRPWSPDEAEVLLDIRSRVEVARWMAEPTPWSRPSQAEGAITGWDDMLAEHDGRLGTWAVVPTGEDRPVGAVSLKPLPGGHGEVEIGWTLHPDAWGRGYAREAAAAVLAHGFAIGLPRVWAVMWPGNEPSARVCRAIGMSDLGVIPDPWYGGESHTFRADAGPPAGTACRPGRLDRRRCRRREHLRIAGGAQLSGSPDRGEGSTQ